MPATEAGESGRAERPIERGLDRRALADVATAGVAIVRGAVDDALCARLLAEVQSGGDRFLPLPARVNGIRQRAEQLAVRIGDPEHPALGRLIGSLREALVAQPHATGAHRFVPTEARYMRYTGETAGLGAHRDGKCYSVLVCAFTLAGAAPFTVVDDEGRPTLDALVHAGDLVLLRAPGFAGCADGRPRHLVGAPLAGPRVSLTLRMARPPHPSAV